MVDEDKLPNHDKYYVIYYVRYLFGFALFDHLLLDFHKERENYLFCSIIARYLLDIDLISPKM